MSSISIECMQPNIVNKNDKNKTIINRIINDFKKIKIYLNEEDILSLKKKPLNYTIENISNMTKKICEMVMYSLKKEDEYLKPEKALFNLSPNTSSISIFILYTHKIITFKKVKKIYEHFKIPVDESISSKYAAINCFDQNSTMLHKSSIDLKLKGKETFGISLNIDILLKHGHLIKQTCDNNMTMYSTPELMEIENNIENELNIFNNTKVQVHIPYEPNINLSENQNNIVKSITRFKLSILTGGPGVGKTHTIKAYMELAMKIPNTKIIACALAGAAAKQLSASLPKCKNVRTGTIAKELLYKVHEYGDNDNDCDSYNLYDYKYNNIIILDEFSMVDINTFNKILKLIKKTFKYENTTLILIGDVDQLPSIGHGNLLHDLIESKKFNHDKLYKIHRTRNKDIINMLSKIKERQFNLSTAKLINKKSNNIHIHYKEDWTEEEMKQKIIKIMDDIGFSYSRNDMILVTQNGNQIKCENIESKQNRKRWVGTACHINKEMQNICNPITSESPCIISEAEASKKLNKTWYRINDRIISNVNIYREKYDIYKGSLGSIVGYCIERKEVTLKFDNDITHKINVDELYSNSYKHAYCMTTHISQGSTFRNVICILMDSHYTFKKNGCKISYTGTSRTKEKVHVITTTNSLRTHPFTHNCVFNNSSYIYTGLFSRKNHSSTNQAIHL
jgi:hypothetical protein